VIAQVAEGLAFAHSRGIAHGDLKPSNIFVDAARDVGILDFGIAKWLVALLAAGGRPQGLLANYLAPEQILGQPFDARSDIFALGLMLYELASGKYPFSADAGLIPREIVHSEPAALRKLDAQIPEELEQLVARALNKNPEQRLQTAEEFASGLYLAAQQLRRLATPVAVPDPSPVNQIAAQPIVEQPVLPPEPVILPPPHEQPVAEPASPTAFAPAAVPAPPVRERPQDAQPEPRPWTSRSYAAGTTLPPKPPAAPAPVHSPPASPETPAFEPPQSFLKPAAPVLKPPPPKRGKMAKRILTAAVGLILAAGLVGMAISRQNLKASQRRSHAVIPLTEPIAPVGKPVTPPPAPVPQARVPKHEEPAPEEVVNPEVPAKQILNGPVRTLWESGRYAQALGLVNRVLASDPNNDDALSWRKKIREAQAAEAALK